VSTFLGHNFNTNNVSFFSSSHLVLKRSVELDGNIIFFNNINKYRQSFFTNLHFLSGKYISFFVIVKQLLFCQKYLNGFIEFLL